METVWPKFSHKVVVELNLTYFKELEKVPNPSGYRIVLFPLKLDSKKMIVKVTVAVSEPEKVDIEQVKMCLPHGQVTVKVVPGGLNIKDKKNEVNSVVASVAVEAFFDVNMLNLSK